MRLFHIHESRADDAVCRRYARSIISYLQNSKFESVVFSPVEFISDNDPISFLFTVDFRHVDGKRDSEILIELTRNGADVGVDVTMPIVFRYAAGIPQALFRGMINRSINSGDISTKYRHIGYTIINIGLYLHVFMKAHISKIIEYSRHHYGVREAEKKPRDYTKIKTMRGPEGIRLITSDTISDMLMAYEPTRTMVDEHRDLIDLDNYVLHTIYAGPKYYLSDKEYKFRFESVRDFHKYFKLLLDVDNDPMNLAVLDDKFFTEVERWFEYFTRIFNNYNYLPFGSTQNSRDALIQYKKLKDIVISGLDRKPVGYNLRLPPGIEFIGEV